MATLLFELNCSAGPKVSWTGKSLSPLFARVPTSRSALPLVLVTGCCQLAPFAAYCPRLAPGRGVISPCAGSSPDGARTGAFSSEQRDKLMTSAAMPDGTERPGATSAG